MAWAHCRQTLLHTFLGSLLCTRSKGPITVPRQTPHADKDSMESSVSGKKRHSFKSAGTSSKFEEIYFRDGSTHCSVLHRVPMVSSHIYLSFKPKEKIERLFNNLV